MLQVCPASRRALSIPPCMHMVPPCRACMHCTCVHDSLGWEIHSAGREYTRAVNWHRSICWTCWDYFLFKRAEVWFYASAGRVLHTWSVWRYNNSMQNYRIPKCYNLDVTLKWFCVFCDSFFFVQLELLGTGIFLGSSSTHTDSTPIKKFEGTWLS